MVEVCLKDIWGWYFDDGTLSLGFYLFIIGYWLLLSCIVGMIEGWLGMISNILSSNRMKNAVNKFDQICVNL